MFNNKNRTVFKILSVLPVLTLLSCVGQIGENDFLQVKDTLSPQITILSPADGSSYAAMVEVIGIVSDAASSEGDPGGIKSISYALPAFSLYGTVDFDENGGFSFSFPTEGLSGTLVIDIVAEDWNGNIGHISLSLVDEGAIPTFTAEPGNHSVTLSWEPVPFAENYSLYYTEEGSYPSENYGHRVDDVSSPYTLFHLKNGELHIFLLCAHASRGNDNWSDYQMAIPLSETTLAPVVSGIYGGVELDWQDIPGAGEVGYDVLRATEQNGIYKKIAYGIHTASFTDNEASKDTGYFYKVRPSLDRSIESGAMYGMACPFADNKAALVDSLPLYDAQDVDLSGTRAYVADSEKGLRIVDITHPEKPTLIDTCNTSDATGVAVADGYAYVADSAGGLKVIDVQEESPSYLKVVGSCAFNNACDVTINGNEAFVADFNNVVGKVDIANPDGVTDGSLLLSSSVSNAKGVAADESYVYAANGNQITLLNRSDFTTAGSAGTSYALDVAVDDTYIYVADGYSGLKVVDKSSLLQKGSINFSQYYDWVCDVAVHGSYAYSTDAEDGIKIARVKQDGSLAFAGGCDTEYASGIVIGEEYAYVADGVGGLKALDITVPETPSDEGSCPTTDACAVRVRGERAYIADGAGGIKIVDANPESDKYLQVIDSCAGISVWDIALSGGFLYAAAGYDGLLIFDVNTESPTYLQLIGSWNSPNHVYSYKFNFIEVYGDYAYMASDEGALKVLDVSVPSSPTPTGSVDSVWPMALIKRGIYGFAPGAGAFLRVLDFSDPGAPVEIATCNTATPKDVALIGDYAYVATYNQGLKQVDISEPRKIDDSSASDVATTTLSGWKISSSGTYLYLLESGTLYALDAADPQNITEICSIPVPGGVDFTVCGQYCYVASGSGGLRIIDMLGQ